MVRKDILSTTFDSKLANRKLSLKNLSLLSLFDSKKIETIILKVF